MNVGNVRFCKPPCCMFTILLITFSILRCDNAVLIVWLGPIIKKPLVRFGKHHGLALKYLDSWKNVSASR